MLKSSRQDMKRLQKLQDLERVREKFQNSTEENYLRIILESYSKANHRARLDIADILYKKYIELQEMEDTLMLRSHILAEIYTKLMQALEDAALLAIMYLDRKPKPFTHFLNTDNRAYNHFFKKARRGLTRSQIYRIYGLRSIDELMKKNLISESEKEDFIKIYDEMYKSEKLRWKKLAHLYLERFKRPDKKHDYKKSNIINVYHNIKHAFKVLLPLPLFKKIWTYDPTTPSLNVIEEYNEFGKAVRGRLSKELMVYKDHKVVILGSLEITKTSATEFFKRIHVQAQTIKTIAESQLRSMDDEYYTVRELRYTIYREKGGKETRHFDPCPCQSGRKFKKCHGLKKENDDYLFFSEKKYSSL